MVRLDYCNLVTLTQPSPVVSFPLFTRNSCLPNSTQPSWRVTVASKMAVKLASYKRILQAVKMVSFAGALRDILDELQKSDEDEDFDNLSDAIDVQEAIIGNAKKADTAFSLAFDGLKLVEDNCLEDLKQMTTDEFSLHLKLKFPFALEPQRDNQLRGCVLLRAVYSQHHFALVNGYINRQALMNWLSRVFDMNKNCQISCVRSGNIYDIQYIQRFCDCVHVFRASCGNRNLSFEFVPVFEFNYNLWPLPPPPSSVPGNAIIANPRWYAVSQSRTVFNDYSFMVYCPRMEIAAMKEKYYLKNVLRLMKGLRDANSSKFPHLSGYMLERVILHEITRFSSDDYWNLDLGYLLVEMWAKLTKHYKTRHLAFFLAPDFNHFDRMTSDELLQGCLGASHLEHELRALQENYGSDSVLKVRGLFKL